MNIKLSRGKKDLFNSSFDCKLDPAGKKSTGEATESILASKTIKNLKKKTKQANERTQMDMRKDLLQDENGCLTRGKDCNGNNHQILKLVGHILFKKEPIRLFHAFR